MLLLLLLSHARGNHRLTLTVAHSDTDSEVAHLGDHFRFDRISFRDSTILSAATTQGSFCMMIRVSRFLSFHSLIYPDYRWVLLSLFLFSDAYFFGFFSSTRFCWCFHTLPGVFEWGLPAEILCSVPALFIALPSLLATNDDALDVEGDDLISYTEMKRR